MINRFEWLKSALRSQLPDRAKVLASALAVQFANDETEQCNPAVLTLAAHLGWSHDTVKRAVKDLEAGGWLATMIGIGRSRRSTYTFLSPGKVVAIRPAHAAERPVKASEKANKSTQNCTEKGFRKVRTSAAKSTQNCTPHIRHEQTLEQRAGAGACPASRLQAKVDQGTWQARAWDKWLFENGYPSLNELPALDWDTGHCLPWSTPPAPGDDPGECLAKLRVEWAQAHECKGARRGRAA